MNANPNIAITGVARLCARLAMACVQRVKSAKLALRAQSARESKSCRAGTD